MKKKWIIWAVVGLLVLLMACGSKSKTTTVTVPTPEPQQAGTVTRSLPAEEPKPTEKPAPTAKPDPTPEPAREYVLNTHTMKFHKPTCSSVEDIKPENKELVECTRAELIEQGYEPCGRCHP